VNLVGKTREQIAAAVRDKTHSELVDLLYEHVTLEPHFKAQEIADRRRMSKSTILDLVKRGVLRAHKTCDTQLRIPLSAVREWDAETALTLSPQ